MTREAELIDLLDRVGSGIDLGDSDHGRSIYVYGITGPLALTPEGTGLQRAPVQALALGPLTVLYSTHEQLRLVEDADSCWAHERAIQSVMPLQTVLPARFGTTFADLVELCAGINRAAPALEELLPPVEGCVELAVRINPLATGTTPDHRMAGTACRLRQALAESTLACLREVAVASTLAPRQSAGEIVSLSYLVQRSRVDWFVRAVGRLRNRWPEFGLTCTGPWSPYSFATAPPVRPQRLPVRLAQRLAQASTGPSTSSRRRPSPVSV